MAKDDKKGKKDKKDKKGRSRSTSPAGDDGKVKPRKAKFEDSAVILAIEREEREKAEREKAERDEREREEKARQAQLADEERVAIQLAPALTLVPPLLKIDPTREISKKGLVLEPGPPQGDGATKGPSEPPPIPQSLRTQLGLVA